MFRLLTIWVRPLLSIQAWLKEVYGWASVHTYAFAIHKESSRTLSEIREEYMEKEKGKFSEE